VITKRRRVSCARHEDQKGSIAYIFFFCSRGWSDTELLDPAVRNRRGVTTPDGRGECNIDGLTICRRKPKWLERNLLQHQIHPQKFHMNCPEIESLIPE
jgi:hypothetical protein